MLSEIEIIVLLCFDKCITINKIYVFLDNSRNFLDRKTTHETTKSSVEVKITIKLA